MFKLESVLHREASSAVAHYCIGSQKTQFIIGINDRTVIHIIQLGCPPLANISLPGISCTFACHNKSIHFCALRKAYSLAQWLNFCILSLQYAKCPSQPAYHWCFPDDGVTWSYILLQRGSDKVRLHLPERGHQNIGENGNFFRPCGFEWPTVVHSGYIQEQYIKEWSARTWLPRHTLSVYSGRYIRITSENTQMYLSKKDRSQLIDLASACIDREVIKFSVVEVERLKRRGVLNQSASVHLQTQIPLISIHCGMN